MCSSSLQFILESSSSFSSAKEVMLEAPLVASAGVMV